ncbi:MAG: OmpA domain protein [bacterium]|nr:OmpA domain protein [bacterium]
MSRRAAVIVAVLAAHVAVARAQSRSTAFDVENFHPAITSQGYYGVDGAFVAPHLGFSAGLWLTYGHDPLVARRGNTLVGELVVRQLGMDLIGSFAVVDRLEIGVDLPFIPYQANDTRTVPLSNLASGGVGDLAVEVKGLMWARRSGTQRFGLAGIIGASFPTGDSSSFMGQGGLTGRIRLVGEWRSRFVHTALNAGFIVRGGRDFADLHVGSQFQYGVALSTPLPRGFAIVGEVRGLVGIEFPKGFSLSTAEAPAELAVGLRWRARFGLELDAAVGVGLSRGYGTPDRARAIFGIKYATPEKHRAPAATPPVAVLAVSPPVTPTLPPPDADEDGVPDDVDQCPMQRGTKQLHGCPPADADHDGVPDSADRCPDKAGVQENQGCPDFDSDGDGFVDRLDKCPFEPETWNGVADDDGCPDQPAALAALVGDRIVIFEPVLFQSDGSVVDKRSFKLLGIVAHLLNLHGEVLKLRVEGHMDNKMPPLEGLELSRARAAAVRRWLIDNGHVDAKRLTAQGFGADRPIADNRDFIGRAKNRRIELVIMQKLDAGP